MVRLNGNKKELNRNIIKIASKWVLSDVLHNINTVINIY